MEVAASSSEPPTVEPSPTVLEGLGVDLDHLDWDYIAATYQRGLAAIVTLIMALVGLLQRLLQENQALREQNADLHHDLHRDSHNSSKPPSSDGYAKKPAKSRRRPSGRRPGAQPGHVGSTLKWVDDPDHIIRHPVDQCEACERDLRDVPAQDCQRRQVFDLPHHPWEVTEHQAEVKVCGCGHRNVATFPPGVKAPVQYGPGIIDRIVYMHCYQRIPFKRIGEWFRDEWNVSLSSGPVMRALREVAEEVEPIMERVRVALQRAHTVGCDETGVRVTGQTWWFHVVSTPRLTWLFPHAHRGHKAMDAAGILPHRPADSNTMHDGLKAYQKYPGNPCLCNAHHERELADAAERTQQEWASQTGDLLYEMKEVADAARAAGATEVAPDVRAALRARYDALIRTGLEHNPEKPPAPGRRRRPAQNPDAEPVRAAGSRPGRRAPLSGRSHHPLHQQLVGARLSHAQGPPAHFGQFPHHPRGPALRDDPRVPADGPEAGETARRSDPSRGARSAVGTRHGITLATDFGAAEPGSRGRRFHPQGWQPPSLCGVELPQKRIPLARIR